MNLNCLERIMILQLLLEYKEGNFITFKTLNGLKAKIGFTEKEISEFDLTEKDGSFTWNKSGNVGTEIDITEMETKLIKDQLIKLDEKEKLTEMHLTLYEKFVGVE